MRSSGHLLKRSTANELVIEFHEKSVTQLPGCEIIVLDIRWRRNSANRGLGLVVIRRQPFAEGFHFLAGIDGGKRRGYPSRFSVLEE